MIDGENSPHAGKQLGEPAKEEREPDDDVRLADVAHAGVVHREHERRAREGEQAQGARVRDVAAGRGARDIVVLRLGRRDGLDLARIFERAPLALFDILLH